VAALLAIALITAAVIGSRNLEAKRPPTPGPSPLTGLLPTAPPAPPTTAPDVMASTFSCAEAQSWSATKTTTWTAGPAPASPSEAENGWIAVWGGEQVPELFLVDPVTGASCRIARFEGYTNTRNVATPEAPLGWAPPRGPLLWSPDGRALAFIVVGGDGAVRDLYVWSRSGLAGPLKTRDYPWIGTPSWSPDGSLLAGPEIGNSGVPPTDVWIVDRTGAPPRPIASGCRCHLDRVIWSDSGRMIAATTRLNTQEEGIAAGSVDADQLQVVPNIASPISPDLTLSLLGFVDDQTILLANAALGRFTARPLDGAADIDLGPTRVHGWMAENGPLILAPDRSAWIFNNWPSLGILEIASGAEHAFATERAGSVWAGWAPNSSAIGYVNELEGVEQGIWVVDRDGKNARRVAAGPYVGSAESQFAWQPVWVRR
jgi:hypothetical protein